MEYPKAAYRLTADVWTCGMDVAPMESGVAVWLGRRVDGGIVWTPISAEEFFADSVKEPEPDWIIVDDFPGQPKAAKKPQPKTKPWIAMNNKPSWLRGK